MAEQMGHYDYYGAMLPKLPEGCVAVGVVVLMKVMDLEGNLTHHEFSAGLNAFEQLGMTESAGDTIRQNIMGGARKE